MPLQRHSACSQPSPLVLFARSPVRLATTRRSRNSKLVACLSFLDCCRILRADIHRNIHDQSLMYLSHHDMKGDAFLEEPALNIQSKRAHLIDEIGPPSRTVLSQPVQSETAYSKPVAAGRIWI